MDTLTLLPFTCRNFIDHACISEIKYLLKSCDIFSSCLRTNFIWSLPHSSCFPIFKERVLEYSTTILIISYKLLTNEYYPFTWFYGVKLSRPHLINWHLILVVTSGTKNSLSDVLMTPIAKWIRRRTKKLHSSDGWIAVEYTCSCYRPRTSTSVRCTKRALYNFELFF